MHLALSVTLNSGVLSQKCPSTYHAQPDTELLMRWGEDGTETSLVDPHLPHVHYFGLKRAFDPNVCSIKQCLLDHMSPSHQQICPMISAELESNPHTSWNRVGNCMLGKVLKFGVWGRWDEVETFADVTFASEFVVQWPFWKGMVDRLPYKRQMSFSMDGDG